MITAIEIENFKAFGERQRIELRPITLLFGPNSGGKSTVLHALHFLREVLIEGNLDVHRTWAGGDVLDLGGIRNFFHGRHATGLLKLRIEFTLSGAELPSYFNSLDVNFPIEERADDYEERIRGLVKSAAVEIVIDVAGEPAVTLYSVEINGEPFADLVIQRDMPQNEIRNINWHHSILLIDSDDRELAELHRKVNILRQKLKETLEGQGETKELERLIAEQEKAERAGEYGGILAELYEVTGDSATSKLSLQTPKGATKPLNFSDPLVLPGLMARIAGIRASTLQSSNGGDEFIRRFQVLKAERDAAEFTSILSILLLGPGFVLCDRLRELRHVGPLRDMPSRSLKTRDQSGVSRWPTGDQAWDTLRHGPEWLLHEITRWLENEELLDTGYRLERKGLRQIPTWMLDVLFDPEHIGFADELAEEVKAIPEQAQVFLRDVRRNLLLLPHDVGVGLSQVIPVLVALFHDGAAVVSIEQPELHLHPRQQAALGDALIRVMALAPNRVLLIETHSEHLILRLLRRIRETTKENAKEEQKLSPAQLRVQYIRPEGTTSKVHIIDVDDNGEFVQPWPDDFFEIDFHERFG